MSKKKHLTNAERMQIEVWLKDRTSIKQIAKWLGKSPSTISREIKARSLSSDKFARNRIQNRCESRYECQRRYLCDDKPNCTKRCAMCSLCNSLCDSYVEQTCHRLYEPPYCCNGCGEEQKCVLKKRFYLHKQAHEAYREMLIETRSGANISEGELLALDELVSPLIRKGQSVHHIATNNPDELTVSEKSIYRYAAGGLLKAKNIDMPRVCRMKPRKSKPVEHKVDSACRIGRTIDDFNQLIKETGLFAVEMDSVIGRVGGKVLLTLHFKSCDLMLAFIRDRNTSQSVIDRFNLLHEKLGHEDFEKLFPVLLTDNGSEFSNPKALEFDAAGRRRTNIFYCDPRASHQKPNVELSHEFIRRVLPKGSSFDHLVQHDIDLMMSHINSYSREKLNDKSPYDLFSFLYGESILEILGLRKIPANDIHLKPELLRKK